MPITPFIPTDPPYGTERRYFREALPLHVADEEESLAPRLRGREPVLDAALERIGAEHRRHEPLLAQLVATCEALVTAPDRLAELRGTLVETAAPLASEFEAHLGEEERVVIPALRRLFSPELREALANEVRERRRRAGS
jgi:hemerythrin-like domain-containing protein